MKSILETLYINLDRPQALNDLELEQAKEEYLKMSDMVKMQYGPEFLDRMSALRERIDGYCREDEFFLGFRTCAWLMLEALGGHPSI